MITIDEKGKVTFYFYLYIKKNKILLAICINLVAFDILKRTTILEKNYVVNIKE